jgi:hypothetical protein
MKSGKGATHFDIADLVFLSPAGGTTWRRTSSPDSSTLNLAL